MGATTTQGWADAADEGLISKEQALYAHIVGNFYPPHPEYVVKSMMNGFKAYWKGEIRLDKLQEACYLRSMEGLYKYFEPFLNEDDK